MAIYGGFAGTESSLDGRDWQTNETILSGEIGAAGISDNSWHVVTGSGTDETALIDGFTITAGNADQGYPSPHRHGGGMYNSSNSNPTLTNCTFSGNSAAMGGGGMYNYKDSDPSITNCTLSGNSAFEGGGGMFNYDRSSPTVTNCTFSGNSARYAGGAMYNDEDSDPNITNCTFSGNSAVHDFGGGIYNWYSDPSVTNCTFSGNSATNAGGMYNYGSGPTLTNCIFWGDTPEEIDGGAPVITYSDVQGGYTGTGNINGDPLFVDADGVDNIAGTQDDNLRLLSYSPCIDAGDNTAVPIDISTDLDGSPRFFDDIKVPDTGFGDPPLVDMGAYERNIPSEGGVCGDVYHPYPPGDLSGPEGVPDCRVDFFDFGIFADHWLECTAPECD